MDQLLNSSEKRLARLLLLLANFVQEGTSVHVITEIKQETLAEMVGTNSISREFLGQRGGKRRLQARNEM